MDIISTLKKKSISNQLKRFGIKHLWIHGSSMWWKWNDIDLLYEDNHKEDVEWMGIFSANIYLESLFHKKIDIGSIHHINKPFEASILSQAQKIR